MKADVSRWIALLPVSMSPPAKLARPEPATPAPLGLLVMAPLGLAAVTCLGPSLSARLGLVNEASADAYHAVL